MMSVAEKAKPGAEFPVASATGSQSANMHRMSKDGRHVDWRTDMVDGPIYAVGDIHGMAGLLERLLAEIARDADDLGAHARVIFLGDAINRGPESKKVMERLLAGPDRNGDIWLALRGNHEQALLDALQNEDSFERFLEKGGVQTLLSYGLARKEMTRKAMRKALPADHLDFISSLPLTCRTRTHVFVHAGIKPGKSVKHQDPTDLMTLREPFFSHAEELPWTVVHGHTPSSGRPVVARGRIGVDTGACMTGILTAAVIEGDAQPRFLSVRDGT
ncbi:MAG: metallophosphoesterase family protein [Beijerinckiaceae bacterium]